MRIRTNSAALQTTVTTHPALLSIVTAPGENFVEIDRTNVTDIRWSFYGCEVTRVQ
jgi:hypothetical protein